MSDAWQYIGEVAGLLPWAAFVAAVAWCWVLELRENARIARASKGAGRRRSEVRTEQRARTNA